MNDLNEFIKNSITISKEECNKVKEYQPNIYKNLLIGYKECMPGVSEKILNCKYFSNSHILNNDFETNPKYILAFDDSEINSKQICTISVLYVFPEYRKHGYARGLLNYMKHTIENMVILQVAVNEQKNKDLKRFYEKMDFRTTGLSCGADLLGIKYIDWFWCDSYIELEYTSQGIKIYR